ncbi:MAG: FAD-dependent oxidoreductase [Schwartzia sp.]|nr:FAD-dependent oxidoreductase [Schwartzia sp. (in: firmicutes)]
MEKERKRRDVIVIGAGMAGLTAALYAGRSGLSVLVLESELVGGQIANAAGIENYPGLPGIGGGELIAAVQAQAEKFGAAVDEFDSIVRVELSAQPKIVETESAVYEAGAVILATGMKRRKLALPEAARYEGRGVHYCELCDGQAYAGKTVAVIGGGNAAVDAAEYLSKLAAKLYLIQRSELRADAASVERLRAHGNVEILLQTEPRALSGDGKLSAMTLFDKEAGAEKEIPMDGVFVNIGVEPNTALFADQVHLDKAGNVVAGEDCKTNLPGVFAAGDVRTKEVRQLTTAAADGTAAALGAAKYLRSPGKQNF